MNKKEIQDKLEELSEDEINEVFKILGTILVTDVSKDRKISILISEITEDEDDLAGIYIEDLENAIKSVKNEKTKEKI
ncbi:MAG: hypothetical protein GTN40_04160 [Candidatus Aenigmarchaeota archaeon]|nr:hypothetical protein [Candidatus Aenigmarchaeota archaeon]